MRQKFEYQFVRVENNVEGLGYQQIVHEQARKGWRLVQVFAPGAGGLWGNATFIELIFERRPVHN